MLGHSLRCWPVIAALLDICISTIKCQRYSKGHGESLTIVVPYQLASGLPHYIGCVTLSFIQMK